MFSGVNVLNSTVSGSGQIVFANGSTITSTGDGSAGAPPRGVMMPKSQITTPTSLSLTLQGIDITQAEGTLLLNLTTDTVIENCNISGATTTSSNIQISTWRTDDQPYSFTHIKGCTFSNCRTTNNRSVFDNYGRKSIVTVEDCEMCENRSVWGTLHITVGYKDITRFKNCYIHNNYNNSAGAGLSGILVMHEALISISGCTINQPIGSPLSGTGNTYNGTVAFKDYNLLTVNTVQPDYRAHLVAGGTISGHPYLRAQNGMIVGSYDSDEVVYTVGGTFTFVTANGSSISISGIGTYINSDGSNDFSSPYVVNNSNSSGSGSLINGIVGEAKYIVVAHAITDAAATLSSDVTGRVMSITTGDGRIIVGGTVSVPEGSTVSVHTTQDEHGAAQAAGSTVSITGGSTTLSGTCIVGGTFSPTGGLIISNGSTVSGVGSGACTDFENNARLELKNISDCTIKNVTIQNGIAPVTGTTNGGLIMISNSTVNITGCTLTGGTSGYQGDLIYASSGAISITNSVLITPRNGIGACYGQGFTFNKCKFTAISGVQTYAGYFTSVGTENFIDCTFESTANSEYSTILGFHNKHKGYFSGTTTVPWAKILLNNSNTMGDCEVTISGLWKTRGVVALSSSSLATFITGTTINATGTMCDIVRAHNNAAFVIEEGVTLINTSGVTSTITGGTYTDTRLTKDGSFVAWS